MISVKKFTTFEELKSSENKDVDFSIKLERHNAFKKVLLEIKQKKSLPNKTNLKP